MKEKERKREGERKVKYYRKQTIETGTRMVKQSLFENGKDSESRAKEKGERTLNSERERERERKRAIRNRCILDKKSLQKRFVWCHPISEPKRLGDIITRKSQSKKPTQREKSSKKNQQPFFSGGEKIETIQNRRVRDCCDNKCKSDNLLSNQNIVKRKG